MVLSDQNSGQGRIGETLRTVREQRGLKLADVSKALLIPEKYLHSVENMYTGDIPQGYLNGILRNYAGFLNMAAQDVINQFSEQCGLVSQASAEAEERSDAATQSSATARGAVIGAAAAALVTAMAGLGLFAVMKDTPDAVQTNTARTIVAAPENGAHESLFLALEQDAALPQLPLTLTATKSAWLEVRGADGTIFRSRNMSAGEIYHPRIGAGWSVSAQDAGAFVWHVGDIAVGILGEEETPVYAVSVDAIAVQAQSLVSPALAAVPDGRPAR